LFVTVVYSPLFIIPKKIDIDRVRFTAVKIIKFLFILFSISTMSIIY